MEKSAPYDFRLMVYHPFHAVDADLYYFEKSKAANIQSSIKCIIVVTFKHHHNKIMSKNKYSNRKIAER